VVDEGRGHKFVSGVWCGGDELVGSRVEMCTTRVFKSGRLLVRVKKKNSGV
jgi:hypothetical protein